jgi:hypothetical protein
MIAVIKLTVRHALINNCIAALTVGFAAAFTGRNVLAQWIWAAMVAGHAISIARDVLAGRMGVDAVAFISIAVALANVTLSLLSIARPAWHEIRH